MVKDLFKKLKGGNLLPFLFFLLVSCCLWLLQVLNEDYETDVPFTVSIQNLPDGIELVDEDDVEVLVRLSDRGTVLSKYKIGRSLPIAVNFSEFKHRGGTLSIPVSLLKKQISGMVEPTTSVVHYHDDTLYVRVVQSRKLLPVTLNGKIDAAEHYEITDVTIDPVDVMVSAMPDELEKMESVETEYVVKKYLKNDRTFQVNVAVDDYMTVEPSVVNVKVSVSPLKIKKVRVPVVQVNFPVPLYAEWLPEEVEISFEVSEDKYEMVGPSDFTVHLDYNDILSANGGYVSLKLVSKSSLVKNVELKPSKIIVGSNI